MDGRMLLSYMQWDNDVEDVTTFHSAEFAPVLMVLLLKNKNQPPQFTSGGYLIGFVILSPHPTSKQQERLGILRK